MILDKNIDKWLKKLEIKNYDTDEIIKLNDEQLNMVGQANQMTKEQVLEKIDLEGFKRDLSRMQASRIIVNNAVEK